MSRSEKLARRLGWRQTGGSFGHNSRITKKLNLKASHVALLRRTQAAGPAQRLLGISEQGMSLRESLALARAAAQEDAASMRE